MMMGTCVFMQALVGASGEGEQVREDGSRKSATVGYAFGSAQAVARSSSPGSRPGGGCGDGAGPSSQWWIEGVGADGLAF